MHSLSICLGFNRWEDDKKFPTLDYSLMIYLVYLDQHLTGFTLHVYVCILIMQDTWEKRLAYLQVTVELIAMSSKNKSTHNQSYAQPVSHLFETAVDIAMHGMLVTGTGGFGWKYITFIARMLYLLRQI